VQLISFSTVQKCIALHKKCIVCDRCYIAFVRSGYCHFNVPLNSSCNIVNTVCVLCCFLLCWFSGSDNRL
jgi:hypothetical protein